jgi:hypothetical protein
MTATAGDVALHWGVISAPSGPTIPLLNFSLSMMLLSTCMRVVEKFA